MNDELESFTYDAYVKFLELLKQNYRIVPFCEVSKNTDFYLILRHDVDASLEAALRMAEIEHDLAVRSTYFVLFSHRLYNLFERVDLTTLKEISRLGHEIGLHYDIVAYESYGRDLRETLESEIKLLERLIDTKVISIARHNVSLATSGDPFIDLKSYVNAYDSELCENYVSDSCRSWFLKNLEALMDFSYKRVQLLIHPFLWTEDFCVRDVVLERLFEGIERKNDDYKQRWQKVWQSSSKVKQYDQQIASRK